MTVQVIPIMLGMVQVFLVRGPGGCILVDCGNPRSGQAFHNALRKQGLFPHDIRLIVITHGHIDHIGAAREIKELTGAPLAIHRLDSDCLEQGLVRVPPAVTPLGKVMMGLFKRVSPPGGSLAPARVNIVVENQGLSLEPFGIPGELIHTPGHTQGSLSLLLENGDAVVGDLLMTTFPLRIGPGLPALADDLEQVKASLRRLLDAGAKLFYPAHGKPVTAEKLAGLWK